MPHSTIITVLGYGYSVDINKFIKKYKIPSIYHAEKIYSTLSKFGLYAHYNRKYPKDSPFVIFVKRRTIIHRKPKPKGRLNILFDPKDTLVTSWNNTSRDKSKDKFKDKDKSKSRDKNKSKSRDKDKSKSREKSSDKLYSEKSEPQEYNLSESVSLELSESQSDMNPDDKLDFPAKIYKSQIKKPEEDLTLTYSEYLRLKNMAHHLDLINEPCLIMFTYKFYLLDAIDDLNYIKNNEK